MKERKNVIKSGSESMCDVHHKHGDIVKKVKKEMPKQEILLQMSDLFKVFGDSTRMEILSALSKAELCVCDICDIVKMSKSAVSHQLRVLRENNLVKFRRDGRAVYYSLADSHVHEILNISLEHVKE